MKSVKTRKDYMKLLTTCLLTLCFGLFVIGCGGAADDAASGDTPGEEITPSPVPDGPMDPNNISDEEKAAMEAKKKAE